MIFFNLLLIDLAVKYTNILRFIGIRDLFNNILTIGALQLPILSHFHIVYFVQGTRDICGAFTVYCSMDICIRYR